MKFLLSDAIQLVSVLQISAGQKIQKLFRLHLELKKPRSDEYYGIKVVDNCHCLDDLIDPVVRKWNDEQNLDTRSLLDKIFSPGAIQKDGCRSCIATNRSNLRFDPASAENFCHERSAAEESAVFDHHEVIR